jgi:hypothetical protein
LATGIGLRENAMAMPVPRPMRVVLTAATARARNGSLRFSAVSTPS